MKFIQAITIFFVFWAQCSVFAKNFLVMQISGHSSAQASDLQKLPGNHTFLNDLTFQFKNSCTYVQLCPKQTQKGPPIAHQNMALILPSKLNSDELMEALLKVRAAKSLNARSITIIPPVPIEEIQLPVPLNLESLLKTAGADSILWSENERNTHREIIAKELSTSREQSLITSFNHPELAEKLAEKLNTKAVSSHLLNDSNFSLKGRQIYLASASIAPVNDNFFGTLALIRAWSHQGATVHLISPYLPYARSDKAEQALGVAVQGRLIADLIESVGTSAISIVRPHAPQAIGFFSIPVREITGRKVIIDYLFKQGVECIISPDAGFQKDATLYAQELAELQPEKPFCLSVINKQRDSLGRESLIGGIGVEAIARKKVAIVDDETATGGTLGKVAQYILKYGPSEIFAVVTHRTGNAEEALNSPISKLVATDTLPQTFSSSDVTRIEILSVVDELAEDIEGLEVMRRH